MVYNITMKTKLFTKELEKLPEDEREIVLEDARRSAKEQQRRLALSETGWQISDSAAVYVDEYGVIQAIKPDSHIFSETLAETIKNYVNDEIERFRNEYHISKRAWNKRGIITKETQYLEKIVYRLIYKKMFRTCTHKIEFGYQIAKQI